MPPSPVVEVVQDLRFRDHHAAGPHPECPERLDAIRQAVDDFADRTSTTFPATNLRVATPEEIAHVHSLDLVTQVRETARRAPAHLDADTFVSLDSFDIALLAAGSTVDLAKRVARGEVQTGLSAVRPPGHHAETDRSMGFCLFNNVAIAARAVQASERVERILILDFDVHHGNGTQHSFESDPNVFYFSTHQFPHYPGTGDFGETGIGAGTGATLNVPMPAGCGDAEYVGVFQRLLVPAARAFRPELILVSCGFDAHRADPLASMELTGAGFRDMVGIVRRLADELCAGRVAYVLEGGYAPTGLYEGATALLEVLCAEEGALGVPSDVEAPAGSALRHVVDCVVQVHGGRLAGLGAS